MAVRTIVGMITTPLESTGLFSTIAGLPLHPLIVHLVVVVLPVAALALVVLAFVPKWANRFGLLTVAGIGVGTVAAFVAKESGEALAKQVGEPGQHASYGDILPALSIALLVLSIVWLVAVKRAARSGGGTTLRLVTGVLTSALALATIGLTVAVGHTGAQAAWGDVAVAGTVDEASGAVSGEADEQPTESPSSSPSAPATSTTPTQSPTTTPTTTAPGTYTLSEVANHANASSCWAAINGNVYDLTKWINKHPGGSQAILRLCGTDATAAFEQQHSGERRPASELAGFQIGTLG